MLDQIVLTLTRKTIYRVALIWAAEYAMLALIEESPQLLKAATIVCALLGLFLLEMHEHVPNQHKRRFWICSFAIGAIYLSFVAFSLYSAGYKWYVGNKLKALYSESSDLVREHNHQGGDIETFSSLYKQWEDKSEDWIRSNLGNAAADRFVSHATPSILNINTGRPMPVWQDCNPNDYNCWRTRLEENRANLSAVMESRIYDY